MHEHRFAAEAIAHVIAGAVAGVSLAIHGSRLGKDLGQDSERPILPDARKTDLDFLAA
jgi:hypothetical protein